MLKDLDSLLAESGAETLVVPMHEQMHASFRWLSRGAKVTRGYAIKTVGSDPLLICHPMEREEAAASGLVVRSVSEFGYEAIVSEASSSADAYARFYRRVFDELGVDHAVGFVGALPFELYLDVIERLEASGTKIARFDGANPVEAARKRKDSAEIEDIADVGRRTELVVDHVRQVLRDADIVDGTLSRDGESLLIGDLKAIVSEGIVRQGMMEDHETILSQGRDAGVPHSRGDASADVKAGSPIVIDIFPCDAKSGYFLDTSRTFCVGDVPERLVEIHAAVLEAFELAADAVRTGEKASAYQHLVCDFFEDRGFPTIRSEPTTLTGYVHGLGHGVGLDVHESPSFSLSPSNEDRIEDGDIITIEPGLYYPEEGIGVRIEDTFVVENGRARTLCKGSRSLEP